MPYLANQPANPPHCHAQYNKLEAAIRELHIEGARMTGIIFVDKEVSIRMGPKSWVVKADDGTVAYIKINSSNRELQQGKLSPKVLKHLVEISPLANVPAFAVAFGPTIPEEYLIVLQYAGAAIEEGSTLTFYAMMHRMHFGFGKDWI